MGSDRLDDDLPDAALAERLKRAHRIFALTGAGLSTGSGIPDFRGPDGLYKQHRPTGYTAFCSSRAARCEYWQFKLRGYAAFRDAQPNAGHRALVALEQLGKLSCVATQNVDGLHQAAGIARERLVELHGSNREVECIQCGRREHPERCMAEFAQTGEPPRCPACDGWMKPAVVMFGQPLNLEGLQRARRASEQADLVLALGSSLLVTPAADLPLYGAQRGAEYVIINRGATPHDELAAVRIDHDVSDVLPKAVQALGALV